MPTLTAPSRPPLFLGARGETVCRDHGDDPYLDACAPPNDVIVDGGEVLTPRGHWVTVTAALGASEGLACPGCG